MRLNSEQLDMVKKACDEVEYGSVTIKMNATAKHIDLVVEKQIRMSNEPTRTDLRQFDKKYN